MLIIKHRINTLQELESTPSSMGIELDVRERGGRLILHHDPFTDGEDFESLLKVYRHAFIVINVKCEGIEGAVSELMKKYRVMNYFFLDISFPALVRLSKRGEKNIAVRFSEFEPVEQCLAARQMANWVWVDCFNGFVLDERVHKLLKESFRICLVSPELQNNPVDWISNMRKASAAYEIDAVCTKFPELWK